MVHNCMSLFCLVDGEATSSALSVKISSSDTVDDLKDLIKAKNSIAFSDIGANELTLWRVSIPIDDDDVVLILLDNVADKDKTKLGPAADISEVFEIQPPKKNIHIVVQRPPPADTSTTSTTVPLLSKSDVLSRILPPLRYSRYTAASSSTTDTRFGRTPAKVSEWTKFPMQAASRNHTNDRRFSPDDFRFSNDLVLSNEESIGIALNANVYVFLNRLMPTGRIGMHTEAKVIGRPDRVYFRSPGDIRMLIQIKTIWVLSCDDLVTKYKEDIDLVARESSPESPIWRQVHQIFGYLSCNRLRYGILTTYHQTWFMRRDGGTLWISPSIHHDNNSPTLLQCYVHLMELTSQDHTTPSAPLSPPQSPPPGSPPGDDGDDSNDGDYREQKKPTQDQDQGDSGIQTRSKDKQLSSGFTVAVGKLNLDEFAIQEPLGEGRTGRVFHATWQEELVALKICDLYKNPEYEDEILTEVAAYEALEALQGVCIPHFKIAGYDGGIFAIAMEIAGSPMEVDKLSYQERLKIVDSLSLIHRLGVIHNDIRPDNVLVCRYNNGFQVHFIDFARSRRTYDELEQKNEMIKLKYLIRMDRTCKRPRSTSSSFSSLVQAPSSVKYTRNQQHAAQQQLE